MGVKKLENHGSLPEENLILFDWLTFTISTDEFQFAIELLGMADCPWEQMERGLNGYPNRKYFGGISILYGASEEMGVCVNMSGQGCRSYESYGMNDWPYLIRTITGNGESFNITRLDMAFDDHTGLLDLNRLRDDTEDQNYVSRSRKWKIEYGSDGTTIYHGSMKSNIMIRIYDKAAERGYDADTHWIRCEIQMRDDIATGFCHGLLGQSVGTQFRGVLHNYLRYVEPLNDGNRSRWPMTDYWEELLDGVGRIQCWTAPGVDYNMSHLENFVIRQAGNAIDVYLQINGWARLFDQLHNRDVELSPKYKHILQQYGIDPEGGV